MRVGSFVAPLFLAPALFLAVPAGAQPARRITLGVGERYVLAESGVGSAYVHSTLFRFDVEPSGRAVVIGLRPGTENFLLIYADGTQRRFIITVVGDDPPPDDPPPPGRQ